MADLVRVTIAAQGSPAWSGLVSAAMVQELAALRERAERETEARREALVAQHKAAKVASLLVYAASLKARGHIGRAQQACREACAVDPQSPEAAEALRELTPKAPAKKEG